MAEFNCIFCKIASGEIPSRKLYENNLVFAFLDNSPLSEGHFLVIPKAHAEKFHELSNETASAIIITLKKLTLALGIENYNIYKIMVKLLIKQFFMFISI